MELSTTESTQRKNNDQVSETFHFSRIVIILIAGTLGIGTALMLKPIWLPGLSESLTGTDPKGFWYLSRGSALVAYFLLWLSMMFGTGITNKLSALWPGLPSTMELHKFTSILGLFFSAFHALILMADHYIHFTLIDILIPFNKALYQPLTIGIGQIGFYSMLIIVLSFYIKRKIGVKTWRLIHFVSFLTYLFILLHAIFTGTDSTSLWNQMVYLISGSLLLFMVLYRILNSRKLNLRTVSEKRR